MVTQPWAAREEHVKARVERGRTIPFSLVRTRSGAPLVMDRSMQNQIPMAENGSMQNPKLGRIKRYDRVSAGKKSRHGLQPKPSASSTNVLAA